MQRSSCEVGLRARTAHPWKKRTARARRGAGVVAAVLAAYRRPQQQRRRRFIQSKTGGGRIAYSQFICGNEFLEELRKARDVGG